MLDVVSTLRTRMLVFKRYRWLLQVLEMAQSQFQRPAVQQQYTVNDSSITYTCIKHLCALYKWNLNTKRDLKRCETGNFAPSVFIFSFWGEKIN